MSFEVQTDAVDRLALLAAAYQMHLRHVARQFNMRLEERIGERTRIARTSEQMPLMLLVR